MNKLFNILDTFNWFHSRNFHCYNCGKNYPFISRRSKNFWMDSRINPCRNKLGCARTYTPQQKLAIERLTNESKRARIHGQPTQGESK